MQYQESAIALFIESYIYYYPRIFRYVLHRIDGDIHSAEDITQEVFTRFYTRMNNLSPHAVHNWLYSASKNILREHYRNNNYIYNCGDIDNQLYLEDETLSYMEDHDLKIIIGDILKSIGDPEDIMIFDYILLRGLSYGETAKLLNLTPPAVRYRCSIIIRKVLSAFSKYGINTPGDLI